jgi:hypothetical protein
MSGYNTLKDAIHKQKSALIQPQSPKIVMKGKRRVRFADSLPNGIRDNPTAVPKKESVSTSDTVMNLRMNQLELDHYGYLLAKIVRSYQKGIDPPKEVF